MPVTENNNKKNNHIEILFRSCRRLYFIVIYRVPHDGDDNDDGVDDDARGDLRNQ